MTIAMSGPHTNRDALLALIDFYAAAGVDCALGDEAVDRFQAPEPPPAAPVRVPVEARGSAPAPGMAPAPPALAYPAASPSSSPAAAMAVDEAAQQARRLARDAKTLGELEQLVAAFEGCLLRSTAKTCVFADGNPQARVMLVGEAPGADEDRLGKPFVGRSGQLLDRMLAAIGLGREDVYIANIVPWRPPGNRTPTPQEVAICLPFIQRQIALAAPEILMTIGKSPAAALLGLKGGIGEVRGRVCEYMAEDRTIRALPTLHPAYLLRSPIAKRLAWRDFRTLRRMLDGEI